MPDGASSSVPLGTYSNDIVDTGSCGVACGFCNPHTQGTGAHYGASYNKGLSVSVLHYTHYFTLSFLVIIFLYQNLISPLLLAIHDHVITYLLAYRFFVIQGGLLVHTFYMSLVLSISPLLVTPRGYVGILLTCLLALGNSILLLIFWASSHS